MIPRFLTSLLIAAATCSAAATSASAGTVNTTTAGAPDLPFGQLVTGGGTTADAWRLNLFAGDIVTFRADLSKNDFEFMIWAPGVDDYTIRSTDEIADLDELAIGPSQFDWTSPFTGTGLLLVCQGGHCDDQLLLPKNYNNNAAYSFTANVAHKTALSITSRVPGQVSSPNAAITLAANVQSPAGPPTGLCNFQRIIGKTPTLIGSVPVDPNGACNMPVTVGRVGSVRFQVVFVPDSGWQGSQVSTGRVNALRPKRHHG